ncbi:cytochrome c biogenesis protein ResB [Oerskovia sp. M15]
MKVNHPLVAGGAKIYLQGNGYAPRSRSATRGPDRLRGARPVPARGHHVHLARGRQGSGHVAGPRPDRPRRLLPAHGRGHRAGASSIFPQPINPLLVLEVYRGDLGLDDGLPQNVYRLNTDTLTASVDETGERVKVLVAPGRRSTCPTASAPSSSPRARWRATSPSTCATTRR